MDPSVQEDLKTVFRVAHMRPVQMLVGAACGVTQASSSWQHHQSIQEAKKERAAIERKLDELQCTSLRRADLSDALLLDTTQDIKRQISMRPSLLSPSLHGGPVRIRENRKRTDDD